MHVYIRDKMRAPRILSRIGDGNIQSGTNGEDDKNEERNIPRNSSLSPSGIHWRKFQARGMVRIMRNGRPKIGWDKVIVTTRTALNTAGGTAKNGGLEERWIMAGSPMHCCCGLDKD